MRPFLSTHLPKPARLLPITLALLVALAVVGGVAFATHQSPQPPSGVSDFQHPGRPAIPVTLPGQMPAFTEADVRAYYARSGGYPGGFAPDGHAPPIESVTFLSASQVESGIMRGDAVGLLGSAMVCVVTLRGPIQMSIGHPLLHASPVALPTIDVHAAAPAYMIFDAVTGNLIAWGG